MPQGGEGERSENGGELYRYINTQISYWYICTHKHLFQSPTHTHLAGCTLQIRGGGGGSVCVCVGCLFLRTPSRVPDGTPPACANRAAYPDPPP